MAGVRRSLLFSLGQRYVYAGIGLLTTAILARLLSPAEMGVFIVGNTLVFMADTFRDFGTSNYLIQARQITLGGIRAAFTLTLVVSVALAAGFIALSDEIAAFYQEPGLRDVLFVVAGYFLVLPFGATALALLRRDMQFDAIACISLTGTVAYAVTVIGLAALGLSYMSLAWAALLQVIISNVGAVLFRREFKIFRVSFRECRDVASFGAVSCCTALLNMLFANMPQLILGRILGFDAVGLYSRAVMLCQLFDRLVLEGVNPVVLPALAAKARDGGDLKEPYLRALEYVTALHWPFLLCLALLAEPVVEILLGPQWSGVAPLIRIVALAWMCMFAAFLSYPVLVAVGRVRDTLSVSLITVPICLAVVLAASFVSLEAVAASLFVTLPFQVYVALRFIRREIRFTWRELGHALRKSAVVACCAATAPLIAVGAAGFRFDLSIVQAAIAAAGAVLGWVAGLSITGHPLWTEVRKLAVEAWQSVSKRLFVRQGDEGWGRPR